MQVNTNNPTTPREAFRRGWISGQPETPCGAGSTMAATSRLRRALPFLITRFGITSINDYGCGDANWFSQIGLANIDYLGIDCVERPTWKTLRKRPNVSFESGDFTNNTFRRCDLAICRDVMMHLTNAMAIEGLKTMLSEANHLLCTSYFEADNTDRQINVGEFAALDLTTHPFNLGRPLLLIPEKKRGRYLGLWRCSSS